MLRSRSARLGSAQLALRYLKATAMDRASDQILGNAPLRLPVIRGARWFGPKARPFVLRVELPLTFEEVVAVLYDVVQPDEISTDEDLCGSVAVTLLIEGLPGVEAKQPDFTGGWMIRPILQK